MIKKLVLVFIAILLFSVGAINAQTPDAVELTWTASPSTDILAGYSMYRSEVSGEDYVQINDELIVGETYTDGTLEWNKTYYYVCRAVSTFGTESVNSNEAMWTVETPPAPEAPVNLEVKKKVN